MGGGVCQRWSVFYCCVCTSSLTCADGIFDRFAVSEEEALSPGGGARICCLSHRVAYQDTQIGETFIPFSSLISGKDYTETLVTYLSSLRAL